jgi:hypothetical protein
VGKPKTQLPDADPFAHLTAAERFAQAVERRDALIREPGTGPETRRRGAPPLELAVRRTMRARKCPA